MEGYTLETKGRDIREVYQTYSGLESFYKRKKKKRKKLLPPKKENVHPCQANYLSRHCVLSVQHKR